MNILEFITGLQISNRAKIMLLDHAVDDYKNGREEKVDLAEGIETRKSEIAELEDRLKGVSTFIQARQRLEKEIQRFGDVTKDENLKQKIRVIKNNRINYVYNILKSIKTSVYNGLTSIVDFQEKSFLVAKVLFLPLFLILITTILVFLVKQDNRLLYLGFGAFIVEMLIFVFINIFNIETEKDVKGLGINYMDPDINTFEELINRLDRNESKFLVNAAWTEALISERKKLDEAITIKLNGTPMQEINDKLMALNNEIEANQLQLDKDQGPMMTAEEYLKLRRELDILKIENEDDTSTEDQILEELKNLQIKLEKEFMVDGSSVKRFLTSAQAKFHFSVS